MRKFENGKITLTLARLTIKVTQCRLTSILLELICIFKIGLDFNCKFKINLTYFDKRDQLTHKY